MNPTTTIRLDVDRIRADFPALAGGTAYFDGPGGSQTPTAVIEAIADAQRRPLSNRGSVTAAARNADAITLDARRAVADLLGTDPGGVVVGRSATALTFDLARTLAQGWGAGDEVVVTRLDHDANIRPWVIAAERAGATVRWVDFDPATGELDPDAVAAQLSERTRSVAVTAASNLIGTMPDLSAIAAAVRGVGALLHVDAVHYVAHRLPDRRALGADTLVCSPYKFFGPHLGVLAADPAWLSTLRPEKLLPSSDAVPERFELGTLPYESLAGTTAAVDYLADLVTTEGTRRERLVASYAALHTHEEALRVRLEAGLARLDATVYSRAARRTPTLLFDVGGRTAADVAASLAGHDVNAPAGHFYAVEASRHLGLGDLGAVRVGLAAYTSNDDIDRLLAALG
ncbi:MAG: cysteine desulfurase-like protein [Propionibacteriaceae bacterium]